MTKREKKLELLSTYLDGEATDQECQVVEILLQTDKEAQVIFRDFQGMGQELSTLPVDTPAIDLQAVVCETLEREALFNGIPNEPRLASWQIYGAAAAFAMAVGVGWMVLPSLMSSGPKPNNENDFNNYVAVAPANNSGNAGSKSTFSGSSTGESIAHSGERTSEAADHANTIDEPYDVMAGLLPGGGSALTGNAVAIGKPRPGTLDEKLVAGRLKPEEVRTAAADAFSNQIVVNFKHASDRWMMEDALEAELYRNDTPRLGPASAKIPLSCDDPFFIQCRQGDQPNAAFESSTFALNVPADEAAALLSEFNVVAADTGIDADMAVNGVALGKRPRPEVALGNCVAFVNIESTERDFSAYEYDSAPLARHSSGVGDFDDTWPTSGPLPDDDKLGKIGASRFRKTTDQPAANSAKEGPAVCRNLMVCISLRSPAEDRPRDSAPSERTPSTQPARDGNSP